MQFLPKFHQALHRNWSFGFPNEYENAKNLEKAKAKILKKKDNRGFILAEFKIDF